MAPWRLTTSPTEAVCRIVVALFVAGVASTPVGVPAHAAQASAAPAHTIERVEVESFDGTQLRGWLIRPDDAPPKIPSVLISSPYLGQCVKVSSTPMAPCWPTPETPEDWAAHPEPVAQLVEWGYAVGWFSVRGTGVSGGCWEDMGANEQHDHKVLVEWLADQRWSNGKVGAMGLSYMSQTALAALTQRPKALKTVVAAGIVTDLYTFFHSPQGLPLYYTYFSEPTYGVDISLLPPGLGYQEAGILAGHLPSHFERACPEVLRTMIESPKGAATGMRDKEFWLERRLSHRLSRGTASVLIAQGLDDLSGSGHQMQEDTIWPLLRGPKAMMLGQWSHMYPWQSGFAHAPVREELKDMWLATLRSWLDHFLRKGPRPDIVGKVVYEDAAGRWHESDRWEPREAAREALFVTREGKLSPQRPQDASSDSFRSYPRADRIWSPTSFLCPSLVDEALPGTLAYVTRPVSERTLIAGNPVAYLDLASDQPGGAVQVTLHDLGPDFECSADGQATDARMLTVGGADLQFHSGNFEPKPFSEGHVRIDLANLAEVLEPGHRLGVTIGYGDPGEYIGVGYTPRVEVRMAPRLDSSQVILPVVEGGFGGGPPAVDLPPRPFIGDKR